MLEKSILDINKPSQTIHSKKKHTKTFKLMRLVRGAFAGLEILYNNQASYEYTLKAIGNYNILFQINLENFKHFKDEIKSFLK